MATLRRRGAVVVVVGLFCRTGRQPDAAGVDPTGQLAPLVGRYPRRSAR